MADEIKEAAKPGCKHCNGTGWVPGKDYPDGSFTTDYICPCTNHIAVQCR